MVPTLTGPAPADVTSALDAEELQARYAAYRRRQVARLVQMLPREAIRPLYRRARAEGSEGDASHDDPLAVLMSYCERLLPLPPFDVWRADLEANPDAHYGDLEDSVDGPTADAPSTMDARAFQYGDRPWLARLRSFRDAGLWRAYIAFEERDTGRVHRTATVFCEHDAATLRERFVAFDSAALGAFLRSALP